MQTLNMCYYVYILRSQKDHKFYIGFTQNIEERLKRHNMGKVQSTKHRKPFEIAYSEKTASLSEALILEKKLKNTDRYTLEKLCKYGNGRNV